MTLLNPTLENRMIVHPIFELSICNIFDLNIISLNDQGSILLICSLVLKQTC